jgi:hypothetical protein
MGESVDIEKVRSQFAAHGMQGAIKLVNFLYEEDKAGRQPLEIGSSSIGPHGMGQLYIGRPKSDPPVTPLESMAEIAAGLGDLKPEHLPKIDEVLEQFALISSLEPEGDVTIYTAKGTFIIPPEVYKGRRQPHTDEELEPFRVSKDDPRLLF